MNILLIDTGYEIYELDEPLGIEQLDGYIRYYINGIGASTIIKIVDLAGNLVTTLNGTSYSNADNEIIWDVSSVQSGVYYGIIESDIDGNKEKRVIKIAVIK